MSELLDETHDPTLESWVESAQGSGFPIQNLPFASFRKRGNGRGFHVGVGIGDFVLDVTAQRSISTHGLFASGSLNDFMSCGREQWRDFRLDLVHALAKGSRVARDLEPFLVPVDTVEFGLPAGIGDYTDFYTSIHHATNVGRLFRPDQPLLPNYKWVPIGYHGRASTISVSGQDFHRPVGQLAPTGTSTPPFAPSARLDFELELGLYIGKANPRGEPIAVEHAEDHIFGICLLNDWSARDIQAWEYQPLGPFLSKSFATTVSPWIVTWEALLPFRVPWSRPSGDPAPLPYLDSASVRARGGLDIALEVALQTKSMRERQQAPHVISRTSYRHAYWAPAQLVAHHTVNGCELRPGDLFGTGTLSGPDAGEAGSLLELTHGGKESLGLPSGEIRVFLQDDDGITLRGRCSRKGAAPISLGEATARVLPARSHACVA